MTEQANSNPVTSRPAVELRVLHGPQAGSRMPLSYDEPYDIGCGDDCAIIIMGAQVEQMHARLRVQSQGMVLEPLQGAVVALGLGSAADVVLTLGSVVMLGRVRLTVDRCDSPWPVDEHIETSPAELAAAQPSEADPIPSPVDPASAPPAAPAASLRKASAVAPVVVAGIMAVASASTGALLYWSDVQAVKHDLEVVQTEAAAPVVPAVPDKQALERALGAAASQFGAGLTANLQQQPDGSWLVSGRAASTQVVNAIQAATGMQGVRHEFVLDSQRLAAAQQAVARADPARLRLRAELASDSSIVLRGAAIDQRALDGFLVQLRQSVDQLDPVVVRVDMPIQLRQALRDALRENQLSSKLKIVREEPELYLEGTLNAVERLRWEKLFADFTQQHGTVLPIRAMVREERDQIAGRIRTVVEGSYPYLMTTTGERVAPGGQLDGRTVLAVRSGEVLFADGMKVQVGR